MKVDNKQTLQENTDRLCLLVVATQIGNKATDNFLPLCCPQNIWMIQLQSQMVPQDTLLQAVCL